MAATSPTQGTAAKTSKNERTEPFPQKITNCLWFDMNAEEAVNFYCSVFKNSRTFDIARYGETGPGPKGSVMMIDFELDGQRFLALNGGPEFKFTEAISLMIQCETQKEIDYYWEKLSEGGQERECGWLKDKFGLSWQVTPNFLMEIQLEGDREKADRAMKAMFQMKKLDIAKLKQAAEGN